MATTYKILGQAAPIATTNTDLYTVPSATQAVISSITVCNRSAVARTFRIAMRPAGVSIASTHYIAYDVTIAPADTTILTIGVTLNATDVVTVYASTADLTFNIFGSEIS